MEKHIYDVIIIGGGPAGYTAALYTARAGLDTLVLEKLAAGGQMALTPQVDNYPGFPDGIDGFTLGQQMRTGAARFGAKTVFTQVTSVNLHPQPKQIHTDQGVYYSKAVIYATGAAAKPLGIDREQELIGAGVSYCAHCDGMLYRGKTVAVVGGGNTAAAAALQLSRICKKVILIHRRDTLRATKLYHAQLEKAENIEFFWNSTVTGLLGQDRLQGLEVQNVHTKEVSTVDCNGLFVSIGYAPATELVAGQLELDEGGNVIADESTATNIPGVFAAGDLRTKQLRQIITAAADGAAAAHSAETYLTELV